MDMNLSKLQVTVKDREAWHAVAHGITKSWTWLCDWTTTPCGWCISKYAVSHSTNSYLKLYILNCMRYTIYLQYNIHYPRMKFFHWIIVTLLPVLKFEIMWIHIRKMLLYTVVLVYCVQKNTYIYLHPFGLPSHSDHHSALSRVPCGIQYVLLWPLRFLLFY